jgi:hypothetical protein
LLSVSAVKGFTLDQITNMGAMKSGLTTDQKAAIANYSGTGGALAGVTINGITLPAAV